MANDDGGADERDGAAAELQLAVVVPVLDEAGNVEPLFRALTDALRGVEWEVIFVDDGSRDGTVDRLDDMARRHRHVHAVKRYGRKGLSSAVIEGAMASAAPIVAVIDGDMQHDETRLPDMVRLIDGGRADMVVGTRYAGGGSTGEWDRVRAAGSRWATRITRALLRVECSDPMSGFFAVRRDVIARLQPRLSSIGFKIALDIMVSDRGLRLVEMPYVFRGRTSGESKMGVKVLTDLLVFFVDKTVGRLLPTRLILFFLVGGLGLGVHLLVLRAMLLAGRSFEVAQTVAVLVAIAFNFMLNNVVTYGDRRLKGAEFLKGLLSFYLVCGTGAIANVGISSLFYRAEPRWWLAGIAGATVGAVWNYAASSLLTWKKA